MLRALFVVFAPSFFLFSPLVCSEGRSDTSFLYFFVVIVVLVVTELANGRGCRGLIGMSCSPRILCVDKTYLLPRDWSFLFVARNLVAWNMFAVCCLELGLQKLFKIFARKIYLELCLVVCWNIHMWLQRFSFVAWNLVCRS